MSNASTDFSDKVVDRAAMLRLYARRVDATVGEEIDVHADNVQRIIKDNGKKYKEPLNAENERFKSALKSSSSKGLLSVTNDQASFTANTMSSVIGDIWRTETPRFVAEDFLLKNPLVNSLKFAPTWDVIADGDKLRIEQIIRKGIANQLSIDDIAARVRKENPHKLTRTQAKGLVTTAVTSVTNQADMAVYEANKDAIKGWQYVAVLDSKTTSICAARDGKVFTVEQRNLLPPAHYYCRSRTTPVFKSWDDMGKLEGVAQVRRRNLADLTDKQKAYYDGQTPLLESYNDWLLRQPRLTQLRHLGDYQRVDLFRSGQLTVDKFSNPEGNSIGIRELKAMTDSGSVSGDTIKFANAKAKLDSMQLYATSPDDFIVDTKLTNTLRDYFILQTRELEGTLSLTNYRGNLLSTKVATKRRVLQSPPREDQLKFNPITGRYEDTRLYQPNPDILVQALRRVDESEDLLPRDKEFIATFIASLDKRIGVNEQAVVTDNLRITFGRSRKDKQVWTSYKAVAQAQIKFDVMNISEAMETQLRKGDNLLKRLTQDNYLDPVLGPTQLDELSAEFVDNIKAKNYWEDVTASKVAKKLSSLLDTRIATEAPIVWKRLSAADIDRFYLRFAHRLAMSDGPDRDQLAVDLGRDLYNSANLNGDRKKWFELGLKILESDNVSKLYKIETFGVQKRRMKNKLSGAYFGPYYDAIGYNLRIIDPDLQQYSKLTRKVDLGLRIAVTDDRNQLYFREGFKTYFLKERTGFVDTRIPITSTSSFSDFPEELVDKNLVDALTWASTTKYKIDEDYYDFIDKLLNFEDDKGKAKFYNERNEYRKYITGRGDAYERFKAMQWLRKRNTAFSNPAFLDHRARIYDRGLISPQSGETFRPFLNTERPRKMSPESFLNLQDQVGAFLGGTSDVFEGRFNSLTFTGRQKIAEKWRSELVAIGNNMQRGKPADIRAVLENPTVARIDGEELGKFFRFAIEIAKIDDYLKGDYSVKNLKRMNDYETSLALEQDASSSGAQIIALTTRNKQLAELSNVVPTTQKRRLYDEIAASTYDDPRFRKLNEKLGLTEKDLRKAAKAQNMVTFYGAGQKTGIFSVEGKLGKILNKQENVLVVSTSDRDQVLNQIDARIARVQKFDVEAANELRALRQNIRDSFNKGVDPGDDLMEYLWFLDPATKELVEKMSRQYDRVVTPDDFKLIANIMSEKLEERVPVLKDFTRYFGRLAQEFMSNAKPSNSDFDWKSALSIKVFGERERGFTLPDSLNALLGIKAGKPLTEAALERFEFYKPDSFLANALFGVAPPENRVTGKKFFKFGITVPTLNAKEAKLLEEKTLVKGIEVFTANKMPKSWTVVPWVNFDGKTIEQNFTQRYEERLTYKNEDGSFTTNILQVPQKTEASWWDQLANASGKINDVADATKARTAFAVNGNHSNDAVIVKKFHLWGKKTGIPTSTIHDAFFANAADMLQGRQALREIYAETLDNNVIKMTLEEMRKRGLPEASYNKYLEEAIELGLIPVAGKSRIGGKLITEKDILTVKDILQPVPSDFKTDYGWYGVG